MSLHLDHVVLALPDFTLQVNVQLTAPVTGLSGPSGAGKTTLLEIVAGLRRPGQGRVRLGEATLTDVAQRLYVPPERRKIGYVPQDLALFPHYTAAGNLDYGSQTAAANVHHRNHVLAVLELAPLLTRRIQDLSGGEKQRIALGRALLTSPQLLLLDEPLSSLDDPLKARILTYLKAIWTEFKIPMIFVSHSAAELVELCQEVIVLRQGNVVVSQA